MKTVQLRVKQVRLSNDDLGAIIKRINSSRSIQWWKDDIKQLLYEVKCLKDENEAIAAMQAERDGLRDQLQAMLNVFGHPGLPEGSIAWSACDEARKVLGEESNG